MAATTSLQFSALERVALKMFQDIAPRLAVNKWLLGINGVTIRSIGNANSCAGKLAVCLNSVCVCYCSVILAKLPLSVILW